MGIVDSKTFKSGDSIAVRLPKEVAFEPDIHVTIERNGDVLTIRPVVDPAEARRRLRGLIDTLRALGRAGEIEERQGIDFPDRPGLD